MAGWWLALASALVGWNAFSAPLPWQEANSPFRAEFEITRPPNVPEAGVMLQVPVCGLAPMDGSDLLAVDDQGRRLVLFSLGESAGNTTLAVVQPQAGTKRLAVYFGSKMKSAQNRNAFRPGPTLDVYPWNAPPPASWAEAEKKLARLERLAVLPVENISLSYNPFDSRTAVLLDFRAFLRVPEAGPQTFMLVSDDAGYLFLNGKLVVARDGAHSAWDGARGESRASADLAPGLAPLRCVVASNGGELMAVVARWRDARNKAVLGSGEFAQSGAARLVETAGRNADLPCPAFQYRAISYIGYQTGQFTEVEFSTCNGRLADWQFGDGSRYQGDSFRKVFVGLDNVEVKVRQGGIEARGLVTFPGNPPQARNIGHYKQFRHYSTLIRQESPLRLDADTLRGYRLFLGFNELNPDLVPVDEVLLQKSGLSPEELAGVRLELARTAAAKQPEKAAAMYEKLLQLRQPPKDWVPLAREAAEFYLIRQGDAKRAEELAARIGEINHEMADMDAATLRYLAAAIRGDAESAGTEWRALVKAGEGWRNRLAVPAVKRNELEPRVADLLERGFKVEARRQLLQWERFWPDDWQTGRLSLARAKCWQAWGWTAGAIAELEAAQKINPLLPNLPDVEMLEGELQLADGDAAKGRSLLEKVAKEYPNHPAAAKARDRLENR